VTAGLGDAGDVAVFVERIGIDLRCDPLAYRCTSARVLLRDRIGAALLLREFAASFDLVGFGLPAHRRKHRARSCATRDRVASLAALQSLLARCGRPDPSSALASVPFLRAISP
jgi:hypothetical protein